MGKRTEESVGRAKEASIDAVNIDWPTAQYQPLPLKERKWEHAAGKRLDQRKRENR